MDAIRMFKRLYWSYVLQRSDDERLVQMLMSPDKDMADLAWNLYARQRYNIRELMVIVYDESLRQDIRLIAGMTVLVILATFPEALGRRLLPGVPYFDKTNGRLAYLIGVGLYLPELQDRASFIVEHCFHPHERAAFAGAW